MAYTRGLRFNAQQSQGTWYVSFRPPRLEKRPYTRLTETFANEREAKQFAKAISVHTQDITAGTINPHMPKRTVTPMQVLDWIEEPDSPV